ncbi:MAG: transposase [Okeania sp. SIO2C9]|uniref:RNA-guided endonuclease InsQ/TnpB family protein n=1 Tax=Okeania sp. SIO2C9 TaxID=2607791 RepID=UPI0013BF62B4|nr:transposase [Okeania sp. SIO2C9]NEQ77901.1 transposase [Okeania sp. SIO2C9]
MRPRDDASSLAERAPRDRKLSRSISDLGWRQFRTLLEGKTEKYGRVLRVISRWEPTSQVCSCCGFKGGKLDLSVREWECLNCGTKHDSLRLTGGYRDENAAINILVAGGQSETLNGCGGKRNPPPSPPGRGARGVGAAASVSRALRQQNVNPPRGYSSVGIPAPLSRGGCQIF